MNNNGSDAPSDGETGGGRGKHAAAERTRMGGIWVSVLVAAIVLGFLLVFIVQNADSVTIHFLGLAGRVSIGIALLFAALAGALLIALIGTARILQLRHAARRTRRGRGSSAS